MSLPASKRLSCGTVILNRERELLLCHVTGQDHWDLPKGGAEPGESPLAAALRETWEETGLRLDAEELTDLGRHVYSRSKDLHLYATLLPRFDLARLHCTSHFSEFGSGKQLPEMDGYAWVALADAPALCTHKMAALLGQRIDLNRLLERLQAGPALFGTSQRCIAFPALYPEGLTA